MFASQRHAWPLGCKETISNRCNSLSAIAQNSVAACGVAVASHSADSIRHQRCQIADSAYSKLVKSVAGTAKVDTDMPVMVMDTLLANQLQLHSENLDCTARVKADAAIRDLVTKFVSRLKNHDNYTGQAGRNLYEDVSFCTQPIANSTDSCRVVAWFFALVVRPLQNSA